MPRVNNKEKQARKLAATNSKPSVDELEVTDNIEPSPGSSQSSVNDESAKAGRKRIMPYVADDAPDFSDEMQKMLDCFGADINKTLIAKRKRLEQYTQSSLKASNRRVEDIWKAQQTERHKLVEEFKRQITGIFTQWDADLVKAKDQEEKLQTLFRQQQKVFQQARVVQSQRLKTIQQLYEQYEKGLADLEKFHLEQQNTVQVELRKEMSMLQKKILMDTQQQEMANVKKSLQTMLF